MLKSKYFLRGSFIVITLMLFFVFKEQFEKLFIKYRGSKIIAIVTEVPLSCDRYNYIKVLFENKETEISISSGNCKEGKYKIGQEVELLKHNNFKTLIWPESQPGIVIVMFLSFIVIFYFQYRRHCGPSSKKGLQVSS